MKITIKTIVPTLIYLSLAIIGFFGTTFVIRALGSPAEPKTVIYKACVDSSTVTPTPTTTPPAEVPLTPMQGK